MAIQRDFFDALMHVGSAAEYVDLEQLFGLVGIGIILFISTNVDDIFVLLGFFADPKFRTHQIVIGQYAGIAFLYLASILASLISLVIAPAYIGLLGLAPMVLGLKKLWEWWTGSHRAEDDPEEHRKASTKHSKVLAVAIITIANGGDNISIYTPLFATRTMYAIAVIGLVFGLMTALWLSAAHYLTNHRRIGAPIRRYGNIAAPFVLVGLGLFILYEAGTIDCFR